MTRATLNDMSRRIAAAIAAASLSLSVAAVAAPAEAAGGKYYSSCANLLKEWPRGVAKSQAAANRQYRLGNKRPAYGPRAIRVYNRNYTRLDRDRDGTACEQSR